jgi:cytosine permease
MAVDDATPASRPARPAAIGGSLRSRLGALVERNPQQRVGGADLRSWTFYAAIQVGTTISVPLFVLGGALGQHERFTTLVPAVLLGALIVVLLGCVTGYVGTQARLPTAILVRQTFGEAGAKLVAGILIVSLFGWFGVQTEMLARSVNALLTSHFGVTVPPLLLTVGAGALMCTTAAIGFRALGKIAYMAVPLLLAVISVPLWIGLSTRGVSPLLRGAPGAETYTPGMIVSIVSGGYMTGVAIAPDITRFLRTPRDNAVGVLVSLGIAYPVLLLLAASLAVLFGSGDLIEILNRAGVGLPALAVVVLATWTSNDKNLYEAALSLSALFPRIERWKLAASAGVIGTALAAFGIFDYFITYLIVLGITISPVAGVYSVDFLLHRARYAEGHDAEGGAPRLLRPYAFAAWIVGSGVGLMTLDSSSFGFGLFTLTSAPTLDALLAAALAHLLIQLAVARKRGAPAAIAAR